MLGLLVERITRHRLADEIDHRLLRPLGLEGTGFPVHDPLIEGRHLHGYLPLDNSDGPYQDVAHLADFTVEFVDQTGAAGAIVSTTGDLLRFTRALLGGRLLPADLTAALSAPPAPLGDSGTVPGYVGEGLGVQVFDIDGRRMYGHTGLIRGYTTVLLSSTDCRWQLALAAGIDPPPPAVLAAILALVKGVLSPG